MICIYDKKTTKGNFETNGLGVLDEVISCFITEELNGDYEVLANMHLLVEIISEKIIKNVILENYIFNSCNEFFV